MSNQQKIKIKRVSIQLVKLLKEKKLIEENYKIILNGNFHLAENLITQNIFEGFVTYKKLKLKFVYESFLSTVKYIKIKNLYMK